MKAFLKEFGDYYGYPDGHKNIKEIRDTEFKRLDKGVVYLDHNGSTLYSELQMDDIFKDFTSNVFGTRIVASWNHEIFVGVKARMIASPLIGYIISVITQISCC